PHEQGPYSKRGCRPLNHGLIPKVSFDYRHEIALIVLRRVLAIQDQTAFVQGNRFGRRFIYEPLQSGLYRLRKSSYRQRLYYVRGQNRWFPFVAAGYTCGFERQFKLGVVEIIHAVYKDCHVGHITCRQQLFEQNTFLSRIVISAAKVIYRDRSTEG